MDDRFKIDPKKVTLIDDIVFPDPKIVNHKVPNIDISNIPSNFILADNIGKTLIDDVVFPESKIVNHKGPDIDTSKLPSNVILADNIGIKISKIRKSTNTENNTKNKIK